MLTDFQKKLFAVANVAHLDSQGGWHLTELVGSEWSCFNGAIRIYWPIRDKNIRTPQLHRYWRAHTSVWGQDSENALAQALREIKASIFSQATTLSEPALIQALDKARKAIRYRNLQDDQAEMNRYLEEENERLEKATTELKMSWDIDKKRAEQELSKLSSEYNELQDAYERLADERDQIQISNVELQKMVGAIDAGSIGDDDDSGDSGVESIIARTPQSVKEAIDIARNELKYIEFGEDVDSGIEKLDPTAGPPQKVFEVLRVLDTYGREMSISSGALGDGTAQWLHKHGVEASAENPEMLKNPRQRNLRSFSGSGQRGEKQLFTLHAKLGKGSANRTVRIYFAYDRQIRKTLIGWVGQKPQTV